MGTEEGLGHDIGLDDPRVLSGFERGEIRRRCRDLFIRGGLREIDHQLDAAPRHRGCPGAALVVIHLLHDISRRQSGERGILRTTGTVRAMTKAASKYVGLPALGHDEWHRRVIPGMPVRSNEAIAQLGQGVADRTVRHAPRHAVVRPCEVRRSDRIGPCGRAVGARGKRRSKNRGQGKNRERKTGHRHFDRLLSTFSLNPSHYETAAPRAGMSVYG